MNEPTSNSTIVVMVEDPGALNYLEPLIEALTVQNASLFVFGVGVGFRQLSERGYKVNLPPPACDALRVLQCCGCTMLVIGTSEDPHTPAFDLVRAARLACIKVVAIVDAEVNAKFRFRGSTENSLSYAPDWMIVPNEETANAFNQLGFPRSRTTIVENPARARARNRFRSNNPTANFLSRRVQKDKFRIIFISELSDGMDSGQYTRSPDYTLTGRGVSCSRTLIVAEELLDALSDLRDQNGINSTLVLRLHPKQSLADLGALSHEFDEVSYGGDPLEEVSTADLVVGMTSMLLLQAHDMGKRCMSLLPREQEKLWLPEVSSGVIPSITERNGLRALLLSLLLSPTETGIAAHEAEEASTNPVLKMMAFLAHIH